MPVVKSCDPREQILKTDMQNDLFFPIPVQLSM